MKLKIFHDTDSSMTWAVRIVELGDKYGLNSCLTHNQDEPLVEFYDTRYEHTDYGQFVSRYYLRTMLDGNKGVSLDCGVADWTVYQSCMNRIRDWLRWEL
jgi:hypothetical protein